MHLLWMIWHWKEVNPQETVFQSPKTKILRISIIAILILIDFSFAIAETVKERSATKSRNMIVAPLCGLLTGILIGYFMLEFQK